MRRESPIMKEVGQTQQKHLSPVISIFLKLVSLCSSGWLQPGHSPVSVSYTCLGYTPLSSDLSPSLRKHLQQLQEGHFTLSGNQQRIFGVILIGEQSLQTIKIQRCWTREFINETLFLPETRLETNVLWQISLWGSRQGPWGSTPPHLPSTPSQA